MPFDGAGPGGTGGSDSGYQCIDYWSAEDLPAVMPAGAASFAPVSYWPPHSTITTIVGGSGRGLVANQLANGYFDSSSVVGTSSYSGWTVDFENSGSPIEPTIQADAGKFTGGRSIRFQLNSASNGTSNASNSIPVTAGDSWMIGGRFIANHSDTGGVIIRVLFGTARGFSRAAALSFTDVIASGTPVDGANWTIVVPTAINIPTGATYMRVAIYGWKRPTIGTAQYVYYDDLYAYEDGGAQLATFNTNVGGSTGSNSSQSPYYVAPADSHHGRPAVSFDGSNIAAHMSSAWDFGSPGPNNPFTISALVYQSVAAQVPIISYGLHTLGAGKGIGLFIMANGSILFSGNSAGINTQTPAGSFTLNTWHSVICTSDGTTITIWIDGVQQATKVPTVAMSVDLNGWGTQVGYRLGDGIDGTESPDAGTTQGGDFVMSQLAVYSGALTATERTHLGQVWSQLYQQKFDPSVTVGGNTSVIGRHTQTITPLQTGAATITGKEQFTTGPARLVGRATLTGKHTVSNGPVTILGVASLTGRATVTAGPANLIGAPMSISGKHTVSLARGAIRPAGPTTIIGEEEQSAGGVTTAGALTGIHMRLYDTDGSTVLALLPDYITINAQDEFNAPGGLSVDLPFDGVNVATLVARDAGFLALYDGGIPIAWALIDNDSDEQADDLGADRTYSLDYPGIAQCLTWGILYPDRADATGKVTFIGQTPGAILISALSWAQLRGTLTNVTLSFTATHDSAGVAWPVTTTVAYDVGQSILDIVNDLAGNGFIDWHMPGLRLNAYAGGAGVPGDSFLGRDRPDTYLQKAREVTSDQRQRQRRALVTSLLMTGDAGSSTTLDDSDAIALYGRREGYQAESGIGDAATLNRVAQAVLPQMNHPLVSHTVAYDRTVGGPQPFYDFRSGDYIRCAWIRDASNIPMPLRVRSITATFDGSSGQQLRGASVELNDLILESDIKLARQVQAIFGNSSSTTSAPPVTPVVDITVPSAPSEVAISSSVYQDNNGRVRAGVTISWTPILTNTDGSPCTDLNGYEVDYQLTDLQDSDVWTPVGANLQQTVAYVSNLPLGVRIQARVRGDDYNGHSSAETLSTIITTAADTSGPGQPSTPAVTPFFGGIKIVWNGLTQAGGAMPTDYAHVNVYVSEDSGFTPSTATLVDTIPNAVGATAAVADLDYVPQFVRLIAVDTSGNQSPASIVSAGVTPTKVTTPDIEDGSLLPQSLGFIVGGGNIISNSSFENQTTPLDHWSLKTAGAATLTASTDTSVDGTHAALIDITNAAAATDPTAYTTAAQDITNTYPDSVTLSAWLAADAGDTVVIRIVRWLAGTPAFGNPAHDVSQTAVTADGDWHRYTVTLPAAVGGIVTGFTVYAGLLGAAVSNTDLCYVDALQLQAGDLATSYAPRPDEILPNMVGAPQIIAGAVIAGKIAVDAVGANEIAANSITAAKGQIAALAVVDANIASVNVGKLVAGSLTADVTVSARIKTANTGNRVEINAGGLFAYDPSGTQTVKISSVDGSITIAGPTISGGAITGSSLQTAADTGNFFTSTLIQHGAVYFLTQGATSPGATTAKIACDSGGASGTNLGLDFTTGGVLTANKYSPFMELSRRQDGDIDIGLVIFEAGSNFVGPDTSIYGGPGYTFDTNGNHTIGGNGGLSVRKTPTYENTGLTGYAPVLASAFTVNSTLSTKEQTRVATAGLAEIRQLTPVTYIPAGEADVMGTTPAIRRQLSIIAEQVANVVPVIASLGWDGHVAGIDTSGLATLAIAGIQELDDKLAAILERVDKLDPDGAGRPAVRSLREIPAVTASPHTPMPLSPGRTERLRREHR